MPMFLSYRNQSIDLQCKSIDRFLIVGGGGGGTLARRKEESKSCFFSLNNFRLIRDRMKFGYDLLLLPVF